MLLTSSHKERGQIQLFPKTFSSVSHTEKKSGQALARRWRGQMKGLLLEADGGSAEVVDWYQSCTPKVS